VGNVNATRQPIGIGVLGGPTTVVDVAGWRFVIDPTFDDPGAARVPGRQHERLLTLNSAWAAAAAQVLRAQLVVPAHVDGWAHVTEGIEEIRSAFDDAGISDVLGLAPVGNWIVPALIG
jgi:hypothetical protein